jgi:hypothetical protein
MEEGDLNNYLQGFEGDGWTAAQLQGNCWKTSYRKRAVEIWLTRNWINVQSPVPEVDDDRRALEWNNRILIAKLCRAPAGTMMLKAEWPIDELNSSSLRLLMTAVARALGTIEAASMQLVTSTVTGSTAEGLALYIPKERIWQYVRQIDNNGWSLGGEPGNTRWNFLYHGHICKFHVRMEFTTHWTHFQTALPVWREEFFPQTHFASFNHLLALNNSMRMARFRLNHNSVILSLHCPTERLNFRMFEICMQAMGVYLDRMGPEIILLASSQRLEGFIDSGVLPPAEDFLFEGDGAAMGTISQMGD